MLSDLRHALRSLRQPAFALVVITTLAVGIGATTAMFSVVNGVLLSPMPYPDAKSLVVIREVNPRQQGDPFDVSYPNFLSWREQSESMQGLAAVGTGPVTLRGGGVGAERVVGGRASQDVFETLGVQPVLGRTFTVEEQTPGGEPVVLLTYALWQNRWAGDPTVLGRSVSLSGNPHTVIGVLPPDFTFPSDEVLLWRALGTEADQMRNRAVHTLLAVGRLKPGVTLSSAKAEMEALAARVQASDLGSDPDHGVTVVPLLDEVVGDIRGLLLVLLAAVGFVLLIACANTADLLLTRATTRRREIAVRAALGASRARVIRQLLVESLVLATIGGLVGVALAFWGVDVLVTNLPESVPRAEEIGVSGRVLAFTLIVTLFTGVAFGLVPALVSAAPDLRDSLTERCPTAPKGAPRVRDGLAIAQIAISLVLLAGAGLTLKSLWRLQRVEPGFDPSRLLTLTVSLAGSELRDAEEVTAFYTSLRERLERLPGVRAASAVNALPISGGDSHGQLTIEGRPFEPGAAPGASYRRILPRYFQTMGIPLLEGREFTDRDGVEEPFVAIINQTMARRYWPGGGVLGGRIKVGPAESEPWLTVIGVVGDVNNEGLAAGPGLATYEPHRQRPWSTMNVLVRTAGDPLEMVALVRDEVRRSGNDLPVYNITAMPQRISASLATQRFTAMLLLLFAAVALLLAAGGVYGLVLYSVGHRTHEFGVRMALGAARWDVAHLVLRQGMVLAGAGTILGVVAAFGLTRLLAGLLFAVEPADPWTFVLVAGVLWAVALLASYIPARRATRIHPMEALRCE